MPAGFPLNRGPDKVMLCPCEVVIIMHTGPGKEVLCPKCKKKMHIAAEFSAGTWEALSQKESSGVK
jgi:hypothetical protein